MHTHAHTCTHIILTMTGFDSSRRLLNKQGHEHTHDTQNTNTTHRHALQTNTHSDHTHASSYAPHMCTTGEVDPNSE